MMKLIPKIIIGLLLVYLAIVLIVFAMKFLLMIVVGVLFVGAVVAVSRLIYDWVKGLVDTD